MQAASLLCSTETYTQESSFKDIEDLCDGTCCIIQRHTPHGLSICYDTEKVAILEEGVEMEFDQLEILPVVVKVGKEHVLIVLVYRPIISQRGCFCTGYAGKYKTSQDIGMEVRREGWSDPKFQFFLILVQNFIVFQVRLWKILSFLSFSQ